MLISLAGFARALSTWNLSSKPKPAVRRKSEIGGLTFNSLEPRCLLAGIYFTDSTGELFFGGTNSDDRAEVTLAGGSIVAKLSGFETKTFTASQIKSIGFVGLRGNDYFINNTSIPSFAYGGPDNDQLIGGSGPDVLVGQHGNDSLDGKAGDDVLRSGPGNDTARGDDGNDRIFGDSGSNTLSGNDGDDLVHGGPGSDVINGGNGNDLLFPNDGDDRVSGWNGNDVINGYRGANIINGDAGNDKVYGGSGDETIDGGTGADVLRGSSGNDQLTGGSGVDKIFGGSGHDVIKGGTGNDVLVGQDGNDQIYGESGNDVVTGDQGIDFLDGGTGNDTLRGLSGNDVLKGGSGNDKLYGGTHEDSLYGEGGNDQLFGEAGHDGLFGGVGGIDALNGGPGFDRFLIHSGDRLSDFSNSDVRIDFTNSTSSWTNKEIEVIDQGFEQLHKKTSGVRVLRNTLDNDPLNFVKVSRTSSGNPAENRLQMSYLRDGGTGILIPGSEVFTRELIFAEWDERDEVRNDFMALAAIHEISHNWDSTREINSVLSGQGKIWTEFLAQSGWRSSNPNSSNFTKADGQTLQAFEIQFDPSIKNYRQVPKSWWYRDTASFFRGYGNSMPLEDWGTMWEAAFSDDVDPALNGKLAVVNRFLDVV